MKMILPLNQQNKIWTLTKLNIYKIMNKIQKTKLKKKKAIILTLLKEVNQTEILKK